MAGGRFAPILSWIDDQHPRMVELVRAWASINTGSLNVFGLRRLSEQVLQTAQRLGGEVQQVPLPAYEVIDDAGQTQRYPLAEALVIRKRPAAPIQVLLAIHLDTVYGPEHPFQRVEQPSPDILHGPGVADAKGGLVVLLTALEALERSEDAERIGWELILNPDEELSSPGSAALLTQAAKRHHVGLVFEPALPDGKLVSQRKGSVNYTLVVRGRAAHAGRDPEHGRNAIHAMAKLISRLDALRQQMPEVVVNVGRIAGGGPVNVVPDLAVARLNIRAQQMQQIRAIEDRLRRWMHELNQEEGFSAELREQPSVPPKLMDEPMRALLEQVRACGQELGLSIDWRPSGGICDGNRLAAAGLPTLDTLGPCGGEIHSEQEYLLLPSLTQRVKLAAMLMMKYAAGELGPPTPSADGVDIKRSRG
ncbi:MAG TPA: hydrolase [Phycisphaeraceae bacterium]